MERNEVELSRKWKIEDIFETEAAWEAAFQELSQKLNFSSWKGTLHTAENALTFFKKQDEIGAQFSRLYVYALMKQNEDAREAEGNVRLSKAASLLARFGAELSFVDPELLALPEETLKGWIEDPRFADHDYMLRSLLRSKAHVLSESEEKLLAMASEATGSFSKIFSMINNADLDLPTVLWNGEQTRLTHGLFGMILSAGDRELRQDAFRKYYGAYIRLGNTIAENYYGAVKSTVFGMRASHYDSCLGMALARTDVPPAIYQNLMDCVNENVSLMHDYIRFRKEALGLEEQHMYDIYAPIVSEGEIRLPYEEAHAFVVEGLSVLGEDYQELLRKAKEERWIDAEETAGKRSGAYSISAPGVHPYVLLNYHPDTRDIFTLAHELGHAMHSYYSEKHQPLAKANYRIFVAEVASTVNEVLLLHHILNTTKDDNVKKYVLNYHLDQLRATLFRQTQFAMFEYEAHKMVEEGNPLTKQNLYDLYYDLNRKIYGDGIVHDEEIGYEWSRIPHFYTPFYVYQYATGITSAVSIANRILKEGKPAVDAYKKFLSSGGSDSPAELLKLAGVDLTKKEAFDTVMQDFADTLAALKAHVL